MSRSALVALVALAAFTHAMAADPKPTEAEAADIQGLIANLGRFKTEEKVEAINGLAAYGPKAKAAVPKLCDMAKTSLYEPVQLAAVAALADIADPAAVPDLKAVIRDSRYDSARKAAKAAVESFTTAKTVSDLRADRRPTVADLLTLSAATGGQGAAVRKAASDKLDALFAKYAAELLPDLLATVGKPDPALDQLVVSAAQKLSSAEVHAAALPLVGRSDRLTTLAARLIAEKAGGDPKGLLTLLDDTLAKPDAKHTLTVFTAALAADDPTHAIRLRMLGSKAVIARRMAVQACAAEKNLPAEVRMACRDLIGDADADTRTAAAAVFRLTVEQKQVPVKDCLAMLAAPSKEKKVLALGVLEKTGGADELAAIVPLTADADAGVKAAATAAAVAVIAALKADPKLPADATRKSLREWAGHDNPAVRAAAVGFHTRPDAIRAVPVEDWVNWSKDKDAGVRAAAAGGLTEHAKTSQAAKDRLVVLDADPDAGVRAAVGLAVLGIDPAKKPVEWLLTADTGMVAHVQLRTLFGLPVIKDNLLAGLRAVIKDSPALKPFKFDPIDDLDSVALLVTGSDAVGVLRGRFPKEEKLKVLQLDDAGPARAAVCVTDGLILTADTKERVTEVMKQKPGDPEKTKTLRALLPAAPDPYLGWLAVTPDTVGGWAGFFAQIGIDLGPEALKKFGGFRLGVRVKNAQWVIELRVLAADADAITDWKDRTKKLFDTVATFLPLTSGNQPAWTEPIKDLTAALGKTDYEIDKQGVTATVTVKKETMEAIAKVLGQALKPKD